MAKLIEDNDLFNTRRDAANLIKACAALREQDQTIGPEIEKAKAVIVSAASVNKFIFKDVSELANLLQRQETIALKKPRYKEQLAKLKAMVENDAYTAELQAEWEKL